MSAEPTLPANGICNCTCSQCGFVDRIVPYAMHCFGSKCYQPTLPVSQPEGLLRTCMETAVILAFQRHNIELEEDTASIEEIAADAAGACFGEECCNDKPIREVEQLIAYVAERERELQQAREEINKWATAGGKQFKRRESAETSLSEAREELARLRDGMHQVILVLSSKGDAPQSKAIKMLADLKTWIPEKPDTKL